MGATRNWRPPPQYDSFLYLNMLPGMNISQRLGSSIDHGHGQFCLMITKWEMRKELLYFTVEFLVSLQHVASCAVPFHHDTCKAVIITKVFSRLKSLHQIPVNLHAGISHRANILPRQSSQLFLIFHPCMDLLPLRPEGLPLPRNFPVQQKQKHEVRSRVVTCLGQEIGWITM